MAHPVRPHSYIKVTVVNIMPHLMFRPVFFVLISTYFPFLLQMDNFYTVTV